MEDLTNTALGGSSARGVPKLCDVDRTWNDSPNFSIYRNLRSRIRWAKVDRMKAHRADSVVLNKQITEGKGHTERKFFLNKTLCSNKQRRDTSTLVWRNLHTGLATDEGSP